MGSVAVLVLLLAAATGIAGLLFFLKAERSVGKKHRELTEHPAARPDASQPANGRLSEQPPVAVGNGLREATKQSIASQAEKERCADNPPTPAEPRKA